MRRTRGSASIGAWPEEMGIYRGEVITMMEALADLRVDVQRVLELLEEDEEEEEQEGDL